MKIYNSYILSLTTVLLVTLVILTAAGSSTLNYFFPVFILEAIIVTELFVYLNSKARRSLTFVSGMLFVAFLVYLAFRVGAIISQAL